MQERDAFRYVYFPDVRDPIDLVSRRAMVNLHVLSEKIHGMLFPHGLL